MTFTSLLLSVSLLGPGLLPSNDSNLLKHDRNVMENLAHLGAVPKAKQSEQLELFVDLGPLPVLPEKVVENLNTSPNDSGLGVAAPISSLSQLVQVSLTQTDQNPSNYGLHTSVTLHRGGYSLDAPEHSRVHGISPCNTNDIGEISEFPDSGTSKSLSGELPKSEVHSARPSPSATEGALADKNRRAPLDFILGERAPHPTEGQKLTERICARLVQLEAHEPNTSLRSDYRQAFITVSLASKGNPQAFLESSYAVHGIHPDKVWPRILANRKERLGREYFQFFDSNDLPRPDVRTDETVIYDMPSMPAMAGVRIGAGAEGFLPTSDGIPPAPTGYCLPSSAEGLTPKPSGREGLLGPLMPSTVGYSADSSSADTAPQLPHREAAEAGEGTGTSSGHKPSPALLIQEKERLA